MIAQLLEIQNFSLVFSACVRLTLFGNRNTYNDDKISLMRGFWSQWSTKSLLNYYVSAKVYSNVFSNVLKKRNLTVFPPILIPEYGQSNET